MWYACEFFALSNRSNFCGIIVVRYVVCVWIFCNVEQIQFLWYNCGTVCGMRMIFLHCRIEPIFLPQMHFCFFIVMNIMIQLAEAWKPKFNWYNFIWNSRIDRRSNFRYVCTYVCTYVFSIIDSSFDYCSRALWPMDIYGCTCWISHHLETSFYTKYAGFTRYLTMKTKGSVDF
jgi:hypothetical protein